jgi:hypothetical protein
MASVFYIKRGDRGPSLEVTLQNPGGTAIDLTNATGVTFRMTSSTPVDAAATIVDAAAGAVRYV